MERMVEIEFLPIEFLRALYLCFTSNAEFKTELTGGFRAVMWTILIVDYEPVNMHVISDLLDRDYETMEVVKYEQVFAR